MAKQPTSTMVGEVKAEMNSGDEVKEKPASEKPASEKKPDPNAVDRGKPFVRACPNCTKLHQTADQSGNSLCPECEATASTK